MLYQYSGTVVGAASMKNTLRPHFSENNIANAVRCNCHQPSIYKLLEILGVLQLLGIRCLETFCCNSRMEACQEPNAEKNINTSSKTEMAFSIKLKAGLITLSKFL
jgi:hypothetical protein